MILMLNCSYKAKDGNTQYFLNLLESELKEYSSKECETLKIRNVLKADLNDFAGKLQKADAFVIGAPLYVDGLPAQAVRLLEFLLENYKGEFLNLPVYVVSNLGFYESTQIKHLLNMVENWCKRIGATYGGGLAIGAGPMISTLKNMPLKSGLNKNIGQGLEKLALSIAQGENMGNYYTKTAIPRAVYLKAAHMTFGKAAKANNLTVKDVKC